MGICTVSSCTVFPKVQFLALFSYITPLGKVIGSLHIKFHFYADDTLLNIHLTMTQHRFLRG